MKIKRFKARTFAEALEMVKKELSEDAVILSSEEKKGLRPYVEVTAAVDFDEMVQQRFGDSEVPPICSTKLPNYSNVDEIKREIEEIKKALEEMRFSGFEITLPEKKKKVFRTLRVKGIKEEFALRLCERVRGEEALMEALRNDMARVHEGIESCSFLHSPRSIMLIGPTGVGKTTTMAKLAALAIREKKRVAIINLDTYRIGAPEQIRTYARILGIPIQMASDSRELKEGLRRFSADRELVLIDTTGRNPKDEAYINQISSLCSDIGKDRDISERLPLELHLLMNTNSDSEYMIEAYRYYRLLPINYVAFTKVDEALRFGNIYNMIMTYQRPIAYITTGQKVPDDIEFLGIDRIVRLILNGWEADMKACQSREIVNQDNADAERFI